MTWSRLHTCDFRKTISVHAKTRLQELLPFYPEPEQTLHRLRREAHTSKFKIMQNQEDEGQFQERNEPQVDQNGQNHRDQATRSFVQPDNPHMLLEEFTLPLTIVQSAIQ